MTEGQSIHVLPFFTAAPLDSSKALNSGGPGAGPRGFASRIDMEWSFVAKGLVRPLMIVELKVGPEPFNALENIFIVPDVDLFVLDGTPQSFDEDVVEGPTSSVHADGHSIFLEHFYEVVTGKLRPLVCIENFRLPPAQGVIQSLQAKVSVQSNRNGPRQNVTAEPVHDGNQVDESLAKPDVGDVAAPHLVCSVDHHPPEQVGEYFMLLISFAESWLRVYGLDAHEPHEALHALVIDAAPLLMKPGRHATNPIKRGTHVLFIKQSHQLQIATRNLLRPVIPTGTAQSHQVTLPVNGQSGVSRLNESSPMFKR